MSRVSATVALVALVAGCGVALEGEAAQEACSELTAAFCTRLSDCDGSVDLDACLAADDALGGPCDTASSVALEADVATCSETIEDLECAVIEDRTSPTFDLPCVQDIRFDE